MKRSIIRASIASAIAATVAACASQHVQTVYVPVEQVKPRAPSECTAADPAFPKLPERDIDTVTAVRDRVTAKSRYREVLRRRAVCRAWLAKIEQQPAQVASKN